MIHIDEMPCFTNSFSGCSSTSQSSPDDASSQSNPPSCYAFGNNEVSGFWNSLECSFASGDDDVCESNCLSTDVFRNEEVYGFWNSRECASSSQSSVNEEICESTCNPSSSQISLVAAIVYHTINSGMAESASDGFLKILKAFDLAYYSFSSMKRLVIKTICGGNFLTTKFVCSKCAVVSLTPICLCGEICCQLFILDWKRQLEYIILANMSSILKYQTFLTNNDNGDVLCFTHFPHLPKLFIHLLLSSDGGNPYWKCKRSFWPLHAIILDLPPKIRGLLANTVLFGLWCGVEKPLWDIFIKELTVSFVPGTPIVLNLSHEQYEVVITVRGGVFDLPAMASVLNIKQFNGEFGCAYCCNPGELAKGTKARIYKHREDVTLKTVSQYKMWSTIAESSSESIFGVKGTSSLSQFMEIPKDILIDSMHLFYENVFKSLLGGFFDPKNRGLPFYLGRPLFLSLLNSKILTVRVPHNMPKFPPYTLSYMKAHDFKNYLLYLALPLLANKLPDLYAIHLSCLVVSVRLCTQENVRQMVDVIDKFLTFYSREMCSLYPEQMQTITVHLLRHIPAQIRQFGAIQNTSMFSFESRMREFKRFMKGTRGHGTQMAEKFFLHKALHAFLKKTISHSQWVLLKNVLMLPEISRDSGDTFLIDEYRLSNAGIVYHSEGYKRKGNSCSSLCCFKSGEFGRILSFHRVCNEIFVEVRLYIVVTNILDYLNEPNNSFSPILQLLKEMSVGMFVCVKDSETVITKPSFELLARCILIPQVKLRESVYDVITPIVAPHEYD